MKDILIKRKEHLDALLQSKKLLVEHELVEMDKIYKEIIGLNAKLEALEPKVEVSEQNNGE